MGLKIENIPKVTRVYHYVVELEGSGFLTLNVKFSLNLSEAQEYNNIKNAKRNIRHCKMLIGKEVKLWKVQTTISTLMQAKERSSKTRIETAIDLIDFELFTHIQIKKHTEAIRDSNELYGYLNELNEEPFDSMFEDED
jgi:hypothetical protein